MKSATLFKWNLEIRLNDQNGLIESRPLGSSEDDWGAEIDHWTQPFFIDDVIKALELGQDFNFGVKCSDA